MDAAPEPPSRRQGLAPAAARALQSIDRDLAGRLAAFESRGYAQAVERLAADQDLLLDLQLTGFTGRPWEHFATVLAKYGFPIMVAWITSLTVFAECQRKGIPIKAPPGDTWALRRDAEDLAIDVVARAINRFRDEVLIPGRWDSRMGASLKTYFVGQCLLRFRDVYRNWCRDDARRQVPHDRAALLTEVGRNAEGSDAAGVALTHVRLEEGLQALDPRTRTVLLLREQGYSYEEIAQRLGAPATAKTVNGLLERHRARLAKENDS